jgi:N-methylhydantoinase B
MTDSQRYSGAVAIELEIYRHLLASVAEEMGTLLMMSAYSANIKERRDFSCALFDADGAMLAQAAHIPVHLGAMPLSVQAVLAAFPAGQMQPDSAFIINDPFAGGTHLPDITLVAPVIPAGAEMPRFFTATRAHHADVGGVSPGSMPLSKSIDEEGLRLTPQPFTSAVLDTICTASRLPDERRGDLMAQQAAVELGRRRLGEMCARYGITEFTAGSRRLLDHAAQLMRAVIREIPDGRYNFTDYMDDDGFSARDIAISCELSVTGEEITCDFTSSADQVPGPLNAVRAITLSAVSYALRCLAPEEMPDNAGVMAPVSVLTRPGSIVDAQPPAAVAGGNVETSQRIVDTVFGALAQALPERIPAASCGSMNNVSAGGPDPASGRQYAYYETLAGGAGAGPGGPGAAAVHTHMTNTLNTPVEALEHAYPLRVEAYRIREGSGGAGLHRGGNGVIRRYLFTAAAEATLLTERRLRGPWGLNGGEAGAPGRNLLISTTGATRELPGKCRLHVKSGERLVIETPGGGGWGTIDQ